MNISGNHIWSRSWSHIGRHSYDVAKIIGFISKCNYSNIEMRLVYLMVRHCYLCVDPRVVTVVKKFQAENLFFVELLLFPKEISYSYNDKS
jgi:uncharacterized protein YpbB